MTDLIPMTALGATAPQQTRFGGLTLTERPEIALAALARRRGAETPAPQGLALPGPGGIADNGTLCAFWTGPDQWMIEAPGQAETDIAASLARQVSGCSVVEQTDGWSCVEITGDAARIAALIERLVNLPSEALAPGRATRTALHHMGVFVLRRRPDVLAIWGMRSSAASLWHAVSDAAKRLERADVD